MRESLILLLALAGCATPPEHENFKQVMGAQVGKRIDDPDAYPVFYRLREVNAKPLANGNVEEEYAAGRRGECRLFFEVDALTRRILRWSYEGSQRECVIPNAAAPT